MSVKDLFMLIHDLVCIYIHLTDIIFLSICILIFGLLTLDSKGEMKNEINLAFSANKNLFLLA